MSYRVEIENRAVKQIKNPMPDLRDRVLDELETFVENPRPNGCKKLKGQNEPAWRVRVGEYRILYRIHEDEKLVRIYGVFRRDEAYR